MKSVQVGTTHVTDARLCLKYKEGDHYKLQAPFHLSLTNMGENHLFIFSGVEMS